MPHAAYIDQAAELLVPICEDVGASSLQWDAEEPWMLAHKPMDYREAAERIADRFSNLSCPMGANAIGFVSIAKFGPLADICDYVVPQAYSTTSSGVTPGDGQRHIFDRYKKAFDRRIVMGLAAFRQSGIAGHNVESAMTACVNAANDRECDTVLYWSLRQIRASTAVQAGHPVDPLDDSPASAVGWGELAEHELRTRRVADSRGSRPLGVLGRDDRCPRGSPRLPRTRRGRPRRTSPCQMFGLALRDDAHPRDRVLEPGRRPRRPIAAA